ncbi:TPA: BppU family phage baseplate upper protein [Clostridium perfringens]|nr:BppU family phage baseplate upper protein [Clostridium perfringens]HBI6993166.1 BppU family phage baseplate upper protein [Clostridium perfringens]HBI6999184.1 BppU family phage baseplate upper protein [Clostridium perfringens]HBI7025844.1 BppU family phage baseplate upper protein [Clostridium perfringens]HBI7059294.1 BppU family phage baseplate upper protein [Clostridium perfringens]
MKEIIVNVDNYNENSIKTIEGDNLSEVYKIYICKNKRRIDLTNKIAVMAYVDEYGSKRSNILNLNITNAAEGEIELPITNIISEHNGVYACQIAIYGENNSLEQTAPFSLIVENNIFSKISNTAINSTDFHILSEAIKTANEYSEKLKEGTENIELQYVKKLNKKLDKDGIVTMENMGQDVKEAMTGGSVAVVGVDAVDSINLKNNSVVKSKIKKGEIDLNVLRKPIRTVLNDNSIEVNFQELKVKSNTEHTYVVGEDGYYPFKTSNNGKLNEIDIPGEAVDIHNYTLYSLWYSTLNNELRFTKSSEAEIDSYVLGEFYQGKPFLNNVGNGITVIDTKGKKVMTHISDAIQEIGNGLDYGCLGHDSYINVIPEEFKAKYKITLIFTTNGYSMTGETIEREVSWADEENPNYLRILVWDKKELRLKAFQSDIKLSKNRYLFIASFYNNEFLNYISDKGLCINGKSLDSFINYSLDRPMFYRDRPVISINFNNSDLSISVKKLKDEWVIFQNSSQNPIDSDSTPYVYKVENLQELDYIYKLFISKNNPRGFLIKKHTERLNTKEIKEYAFVCCFTQNWITGYIGSTKNILLNDKEAHILGEAKQDIQKKEIVLDRPVFYNTLPVIDLRFDKNNNTIKVKRLKNTWLLYQYHPASAPQDQDGEEYIFQASADSLGYAYRLYVSRKDGAKFLIKRHHEALTPVEIEEFAFICCFSNNTVSDFNGASSNMLIDGKEAHILGEIDTVNNWSTNRFVVPNDLYLVKDIPYSIFAPNFNVNQLVDNDDCLFEIGLPTKVVQFEQSADIQIPMMFEKDKPYKTRIAGINKLSKDMYTKDINLYVADPSKVIKKDVKVLCIGDSITESNFPKNLKWQLSKFGINATMIGTRNDSHNAYKYGISEYLPIAKGEGRGGWRLTDFACKTPLKEGGYYRPTFEMMNPDTQKFDFSYYMRNQNFEGVDMVVINLGTNDITGYHYQGSAVGSPVYDKIRRVDLDTEYLNPSSEYYLGKIYGELIDSIHAYNPNIKIGINPPMTSGITGFIVSSMKWAEVLINSLKDKPNVYILGSYLAQGQLSTFNMEDYRDTLQPVSEINGTLKGTRYMSNVHVNGMGQLIHSLYPASWIVNMCL